MGVELDTMNWYLLLPHQADSIRGKIDWLGSQDIMVRMERYVNPANCCVSELALENSTKACWSSTKSRSSPSSSWYRNVWLFLPWWTKIPHAFDHNIISTWLFLYLKLSTLRNTTLKLFKKELVWVCNVQISMRSSIIVWIVYLERNNTHHQHLPHFYSFSPFLNFQKIYIDMHALSYTMVTYCTYKKTS